MSFLWSTGETQSVRLREGRENKKVRVLQVEDTLRVEGAGLDPGESEVDMKIESRFSPGDRVRVKRNKSILLSGLEGTVVTCGMRESGPWCDVKMDDLDRLGTLIPRDHVVRFSQSLVYKISEVEWECGGYPIL